MEQHIGETLVQEPVPVSGQNDDTVALKSNKIESGCDKFWL